MVTSADLIERTTEAPVEAPVAISVATADDARAWDAFVSGSGGDELARSYHTWAWRSVIERTFGHEAIYLAARGADGEIAGVLPLVFIRSRLFGRSTTSLPFLTYGGVLAASDTVARALVKRAGEEARARGSRHVELRHVGRRFDHLPCKQHKVVMRLTIGAGLWEQLDRKVRNQIRKAEKSNLKAVEGGLDLVDEFYAVFARNMRDLGTPVYGQRLFEEVLRALPGQTRLVVVRLGDRPVAAGLTYRTGSAVQVPWASSIRDFNALCPNHLLYWHIIESAIAAGANTLDFGRSTPDEGTYKFKAQWGAVPAPLHWEYLLLDGGQVPDASPKNPKFQVAIRAWQRCPLWLANRVGPHIVRSIP